MAGLQPLGVICEVLGEDGSAMRGAELLQFAKQHQLRSLHIRQILEKRVQSESFLEFSDVAKLPTRFGDFEVRSFRSQVDGSEHMVILRGEIKNDMLVRIHSMCLTGDAIGSQRCDCRDQLQASLERIAHAGSGMVVYLQQEGRGIGLFHKIKAYVLQDQGMDTVDANLALGFRADQREFGLAAQVLKHYGLRSVRLLTNNPEKISALEKWGNVHVQREPLLVLNSDQAKQYVTDKQNKMGHLQ
jgi:3,4-dihydroxy 2-butanone 4-phosphate synthase/GTP cyclohydrolase II